MSEYIRKSLALEELEVLRQRYEMQDDCDELVARKCKEAVSALPSADVAPVVHGTPMLRYRTQRYERYEECGLNENGEVLYLKRVFVDEKNYAMYCPACGKRLCSRFKSFCPNCGAKMYGGKYEID